MIWNISFCCVERLPYSIDYEYEVILSVVEVRTRFIVIKVPHFANLKEQSESSVSNNRVPCY